MAVRPSLMLMQPVACVVSAWAVAAARLVWPTPALAAPAMLPMLTLPLALCGSHLQTVRVCLQQGGAGGIAGRTRECRWSAPAFHISLAMAAQRLHTPAQPFASGQWAWLEMLTRSGTQAATDVQYKYRQQVSDPLRSSPKASRMVWTVACSSHVGPWPRSQERRVGDHEKSESSATTTRTKKAPTSASPHVLQRFVTVPASENPSRWRGGGTLE